MIQIQTRTRPSLNPRPNLNAGIRCMARPDTKCQRLPVPMRTTKREAIMKDWLMKASPEQNMIKPAKPPEQPQKNLYEDSSEPHGCAPGSVHRSTQQRLMECCVLRWSRVAFLWRKK